MRAPEIHVWARQDIAKLRARGIEPTIDEMVWLARLAELAHTPPGRVTVEDVAAPVKFAGETFWPLHMLAQRWFVQWFEAFEGQDEMRAGVYLYAHTKSKPGDKSLRELSDMDEVARVVSEWLNNAAFRSDQLVDLQAALQRMADDEQDIPAPDEKSEQRGATQEDRISSLCSAFEGTTPEFWESEICERQAMMVVASRIAQENGGAWANSPLRARRMANYMNAIKWIVKRSEGEAAKGQE